MDIKNALNAVIPPQLRAKEGVDRSIKMGNTTDRDANGQQAYQEREQHQEPMTEEQFEKALEALADLPAVKEHHLTIERIEKDGKRLVLLKEPDGKILRRIQEAELWTLPEMKSTDSSHKKGQLLRKTA
jgi:hypothetical protein